MNGPVALHLTVNGREQTLAVPRAAPLLGVLRNDLQLNGPKYGCGLGECGACLVLIDGRPARSCSVPVGGVEGRSITTLEGLSAPDGTLHAVQQAFIECQAAQCGYCLNGMIVSTSRCWRVSRIRAMRRRATRSRTTCAAAARISKYFGRCSERGS